MEEFIINKQLAERYAAFRAKIAEMFSTTTQEYVDRALAYADRHIGTLKRYNGEPMLDHDVEVARIVATEVGLGRNSTVAAIIHDAVRIVAKSEEDGALNDMLKEINELFGQEVVGIVVGLANISELKMNTQSEQASDFRDMIVAYSEDPRVILIKLADRLEVMRSIEMFPEAKRQKKSWESMNLYAQIAHKLGLYNIKSELEDLALSQLEPADYRHICDKLAESEQERLRFIERFIEPIQKALDAASIRYHIKSRTKSIYSIWNKMRKQKVPFEGVYDIFALRIIIDCPKEQEKMQCWTVYSIVSDFYTPNTERMRDWITIPKSNGYESLHTTVSAGDGRWVEIQIRTERMDDVAELGIAAHWRYKGVNQGAQTSEQWLQRLRELMDETKEDIAERFDAKPVSNEIFVFTPNGDIRKLPEGATILDFAFDIHTNLGSTCAGGKVNGRAVPIRETLKNGDIVEILSQKNQQPKADWLN
ncbi:MAG: bifunctional (p)ppGpp synthetase/guanosine-3',5'-bis(diphosphate) 3'-pyrophosphohydrolase, partial [Alistipes sp.]|nr:bifunctional (p)ppGpp synthetase/guanosine-3',5'-bis(diphosphate) 3'-pyrophosphohydrolase [Alistipes sp.]